MYEDSKACRFCLLQITGIFLGQDARTNAGECFLEGGRGGGGGGREGEEEGREGEGKRRGGREGQINMKENGGGYRRVSQISYVFGSIVNIG